MHEFPPPLWQIQDWSVGGILSIVVFGIIAPLIAARFSKPSLRFVSAWASDDRGSSTEEHWIAPKGGIMLGVNRGVSRNGKASFEFLRIAETPDGITYFASPGGKEPRPFLLKEWTADSVTFENPDHDFPQRVVYRKVEGNLIARIEGSINGKVQSMEWTWKPVAE